MGLQWHPSNFQESSSKLLGCHCSPATFRNPPPLTEWGKQRHAETLGDKNAAGEFLHNKDTYNGTGGILIAQCFRVPLFSPFRQRRRIPESCWDAIVAPYAGQVARIRRVAFDLVLRLRIRSVLVVLAPGALLPPFGSRYRGRTLGHSGN